MADDDSPPDDTALADGDMPPLDSRTGFTVFDSAIGSCGIAWGPGGITAVQLPEESADEVRAAFGRAQPGVVEAVPPPEIRAVVERIQALLAGRSRDDLADVVLDTSQLSDFLRRVYAVTRTIAPGHTLSYGQVAERVGSPGSARAVGRAMGANPYPIIVPCHRVLGADGSIGGFSAHGGAMTKRRMLLSEGADGADGPALFPAEQLYPPDAGSV